MKKMTIRDLINLKGKRKIVLTLTTDPYIAKACEIAGIDNTTVGEENLEEVFKSCSQYPDYRYWARSIW